MGNSICILIPVYNAEKHLERCLNSIINQTYGNWHTVLIDDGSTDGSREIIERYIKQDPRFTAKFNQKNAGVVAVRNQGLSMVTGDYLTFLDADDWWERDYLERLYTMIVENDADIAQCGYQYNYPNGLNFVPAPVFKRSMVLEKNQFNRLYFYMLTGMRMNHVCMKMIKTELIKDIYFMDNLKTAEDLAFCVELIPRAGRYAYTPEPMYHYYRETNSLTSGSLTFRDKWNANKIVSDLMISKMKEWGTDNIPYRALAHLRPYILVLSKIKRILSDRYFMKAMHKQEKVEG